MIFPPPIQSYFHAEAPADADAILAAFAETAVVEDEGATHRGTRAILQWWRAAQAKYRHRVEPLAMTEVAGKILVRARVSGDFSGSPVVLTFGFGLQGNRITDLRID